MTRHIRKVLAWVAAAACLAALAGCGGGGGDGDGPTRVSELEDQLAAEQALREAAEAAAEEAADERQQEIARLNLAVRTLTAEQEAEDVEQQQRIAELTQAVEDLTAEQADADEQEQRIAELTKAVEDLIAAQEAEPETPAVTLGDLAGDTTTTDTTTTDTTTTTPTVLPSVTDTATTTPTTPTTTTPTTPTTPTTGSQTAEENRQRAMQVQAAFDTATGITMGPFAASSRASVVPGTTRGSQTLGASGYTAGAGPAVTAPFLSMKGTFTGTRRTIVAIADREVSRRFLDHYGEFKESDAALRVVIEPGDSTETVPSELMLTTDLTARTDTDLVLTHGFTESIRAPTATGTAEGDNDPADKEAASFSGSIHGITGRFGCGTGCEVTLSATYTEDTDSTQVNVDPGNGTPVPRYTQRMLDMVALSVPDGESIYFTPSPSALLYLGPPGATGAGVLSETDNAYMLFGWWKDEPTAPTAPHPVGVFAEVVPATAVWAGTETGSATYTGPAVGLYVEQATTGAQTGEFTALATLNANFGTPMNIGGNIQNFQTTGPSTTSSRWHLTLSPDTDGLTTGVVTGGVNIVGFQASTPTTGAWQATFLDNHQYSRYSDDGGTPNNDRPLSAVGEFNAQIAGRLHLIGAFGVHDPIGIAK